MKVSINGEWLDAPLVHVPCQCSAGVCPKPVVTFGEGHTCSMLAGHEGQHKCKRCELPFWLDPLSTDWHEEREKELRTAALQQALNSECVAKLKQGK